MVTHHSFVSEAGFAHVADLDEIAARDFSLSIPLYVKRNEIREEQADYESRSLKQLWQGWEEGGREFWREMDGLVEMLDELP